MDAPETKILWNEVALKGGDKNMFKSVRPLPGKTIASSKCQNIWNEI